MGRQNRLTNANILPGLLKMGGSQRGVVDAQPRPLLAPYDARLGGIGGCVHKIVCVLSPNK